MRKTVVLGIAFMLSFILMTCGIHEIKMRIGEPSHIEQVNTTDGLTVFATPEVSSTEHPDITIVLQNHTTKTYAYNTYAGAGGLEIEQNGSWYQVAALEAPPRTEILQTILAGQTLEFDLDFSMYGEQIPPGRYRYVCACKRDETATHYITAEFVLK